MLLKTAIYGLCLSWILLSCRSEPYINTFDTINWQSDANGCRGDRLTQLELLIDQQQELLGWSESEITSYLGSPDSRELYVRNQKFLTYYLEPTLDCGTDGKVNPLRLNIRMDALGYSKEISLKNQ